MVAEAPWAVWAEVGEAPLPWAAIWVAWVGAGEADLPWAAVIWAAEAEVALPVEETEKAGPRNSM